MANVIFTTGNGGSFLAGIPVGHVYSGVTSGGSSLRVLDGVNPIGKIAGFTPGAVRIGYGPIPNVRDYPTTNPFNVDIPNWGAWEFGPGYLNVAYEDEWEMTNVNTPVVFSLLSGSMPTGLSLTTFGTGRGRISGTPTVLGTYSFTLRAVNSYGTVDKAFSITISSAGGGGGTYIALL